MAKVRISILCDNRCESTRLETEHGFSCLLEVGDFKLLIDMGETDLFLRNAGKMKINMSNVQNALITHGHYDHGGGASHLRGKDIFIHGKTFQRRFKPPTEEFDLKEETLVVENKDKNNWLEIDSNVVINGSVFLIPNIPVTHEFERGSAWILEDGSVDELADEICVAVKTDKGLVIISGCAHRGICSTVDYARWMTGESRVSSVIGGFHLRKLDDKVEKTLEYFKANPVGSLLMAHCNSDEVIEKFKEELPNMAQMISTGMVVEL